MDETVKETGGSLLWSAVGVNTRWVPVVFSPSISAICFEMWFHQVELVVLSGVEKHSDLGKVFMDQGTAGLCVWLVQKKVA